MEESKFLNVLEKINEWSQKFAFFEENPQKFLEERMKLDRQFLEEQRENYANDSYYTKLAPVNFIRLVLLDLILEGEKKLNVTILKDMQKNIIEKNSEYFSNYIEHKPYIEAFASKNPFKSWTDFKILFMIYYNFYKEEIMDLLIYFVDYLEKTIIKPIVKVDLKRKISSFDGNSFFGRSSVWFALYPIDKKSHQFAFQYFFSIDSKKGINYGLYPGDRIIGEKTKFDEGFPLSEFNLEKYVEKVKEQKNQFISENKNLKLKPKSKGKKISEVDIDEQIEFEGVTEDEEVEDEIEVDKHQLNLILYGLPGTGKTVLAIKKAVEIIDPEFDAENFDFVLQKFKKLKEEKRIKFITFHQSYSYEDFIEGYKYDKEKKIPKEEPGILKKFIETMKGNSGNFVLIIDEINRGNIANIFGDIITLIEPDKRAGEKFETEIELPYSHDPFSIPNNLYIIGTMNTADRSIALLDMALRRRFKFEEVLPNSKIIEDSIKSNFPTRWKAIIDIFEILNKRIEILIDKDHTIGHSYFMNLKNEIELYDVWYSQILPLLKEYFYNDWISLKKILGIYQEKDGKEWGFIKELKLEYKNVLTDITLDEYPCEFKIYDNRKSEFLTILKNTFLEKQK